MTLSTADYGTRIGEPHDLSCAEFSRSAAIFRGKVFEAGTYPHQRIEMTAEDNVRACERFVPVHVKDTHQESQSVFAGRLGEWVSASAEDEGREVHARLTFPMPLVELFGRDWKPKVSVEIDRTSKTFTGIALLNYPQVSDAEVSAAFAAHDLTVRQAATCEPGGVQMGAHEPARDQASTAMENRMSLKEKLMAFFGKADRGTLEAEGITADVIDALRTAELTAPVAPPPLQEAAEDNPRELAAQIAEMQKRDQEREVQLAAMQLGTLQSRAAAFALEWKQKRRITEAEREPIAALFVMAAKADGDGKSARFGADGSVEVGENVRTLIQSMESRRELALFETQIAGEAGSALADRETAARESVKRALDAYNRPAGR